MLRWNLFPWSLVYSNFSLLHISVCSLYWIYYKMLSVYPTGYIQEASKQVRGVVVQSEIISSKRERARDSSQHFAMPWQVIREIASEKWAQKFHTSACLQMPPLPQKKNQEIFFLREGGGLFTGYHTDDTTLSRSSPGCSKFEQLGLDLNIG